ncbi:hypothetical protein ACHAXA_006910 [Cyclostephanos tholiformis]|uniref:TLDc domain-containing protein n=1 Tax=Cyclostephanos tholiformis TaxID=382380 RepID=A0ABD3RRQ6_9STRA
MDELSVANTRLKVARDEHERDYEEKIKAQDEWESRLHERMNQLIQRKKEIAEINGNLDDDLVEVNAGGKLVVAKRSTLTQIQGTLFEAIFSGRWDKKLLRDNQGRIFLDVNPTCFRAIVDHLNEMTISSKESPPSPPIVEDEYKHPLQHQLEVFGILPMIEMPDSNIIKDQDRFIILHDWLKEDDSEGGFFLLYRGSCDGLTNRAFHSKCDNKGCTLTIIETTCGMVIGGYSNTSWSCSGSSSRAANKAFLFVLSGSDILSPCKMKLENENDLHATYHNLQYGPTFGGGHDMMVDDCDVDFNIGSSFSYHPGSNPDGEYTIKEMEVFQVTKSSLPARAGARIIASRGMQPQDRAEPVTRFTPAINEAINSRRACLLQAEAEMLNFEESFKNEQLFVEKFASGDAQNIIALNVSGTLMVTTRATLCTIKDSVLAQQFDDSKWTEQGCNGSPVREWTPDQVNTWAKNIDGLPEEVSVMLYENEITGRELLTLSHDNVKMMGVKRVASVALLLKEISLLEHGTLIEHSPYCFGKILDYLRSKRLHLLGLIKNEPALPVVCDLQKNRFEKVVKYYFPGDAAKSILG